MTTILEPRPVAVCALCGRTVPARDDTGLPKLHLDPRFDGFCGEPVGS